MGNSDTMTCLVQKGHTQSSYHCILPVRSDGYVRLTVKQKRKSYPSPVRLRHPGGDPEWVRRYRKIRPDL